MGFNLTLPVQFRFALLLLGYHANPLLKLVLWSSYQFEFVVNTCFNSCNRFRYGKKVRLPLFAFTVAKWLSMNREQSVIVLHLFSFTGWVGSSILAK